MCVIPLPQHDVRNPLIVNSDLKGDLIARKSDLIARTCSDELMKNRHFRFIVGDSEVLP